MRLLYREVLSEFADFDHRYDLDDIGARGVWIRSRRHDANDLSVVERVDVQVATLYEGNPGAPGGAGQGWVQGPVMGGELQVTANTVTAVVYEIAFWDEPLVAAGRIPLKLVSEALAGLAVGALTLTNTALEWIRRVGIVLSASQPGSWDVQVQMANLATETYLNQYSLNAGLWTADVVGGVGEGVAVSGIQTQVTNDHAVNAGVFVTAVMGWG